MANSRKNRGFSLVEMLVVVSIIVLMLSLAMPNAAELIRSQKLNSAENMIRGAISQARSHAATNQRYAGVRFQFDRTGWEKGRQYLVLIENQPIASNTFVAVPNVKPLLMPDGLGVISLGVNNDNMLLDNEASPTGILGSTTFSIIFSPTGQIVFKNIYLHPKTCLDKTINHYRRVELPSSDNRKALLYCDEFIPDSFETDPDFPNSIPNKLWCITELSTGGLYMYETEKMLAVPANLRWSEYVSKLTPMLINGYTGQIIEEVW